MSIHNSNFTKDPFLIPLNKDYECHSRDDDYVCVVGIFGKFKSRSENFICQIAGTEFYSKKLIGSDNCWISCCQNGNVLYLQLNSLYNHYDLLNNHIKHEEFSDRWDEFEYEYLRNLLFLFSTCHIVLNYSDIKEFDLSLLEKLQAIENNRLRINSSLCKLLKEHNIPSAWRRNGRHCTPRLLFYAHGNFSKSKKEGEYPNLIYRLLKLANLMSTSEDLLCCIPSDRNLIYYPNEAESFQDFLSVSVQAAVGNGFRAADDAKDRYGDDDGGDGDGGGRGAAGGGGSNDYEGVTLKQWISVNNAIYDYIVVDLVNTRHLKTGPMFTKQFFAKRSKHALTKALHVYKTDLPQHYDLITHENKLKVALNAYSYMVNFPCGEYLRELEENCASFWSHHASCAVLSIFGRHCSLQRHKNESHFFNASVVSTCNCGQSQRTRYEPFTIREANYDFYEYMNGKCCKKLQKQQSDADLSPTTDTLATPASLRHRPTPPSSGQYRRSQHRRRAAVMDHRRRTSASDSHSDSEAYTDVSTSSYDEEDEEEERERDEEEEEAGDKGRDTVSPPGEKTDDYDNDRLQINDQSSYISYSFQLIMSYEEYNPFKGLQFTNFSKNAMYLPHYDFALKVLGNKKKKKRRGVINDIRLFFGLEYECTKGHRFLCSAPDETVKENTFFSLFNTDMPLYTKCYCNKSGKKKIAQLMRIYAGIPKVKNHQDFVTLNVKVEFGAKLCFQERLPLQNGNISSLRLPYAYEFEGEPMKKVYGTGRICKGLFEIERSVTD